MGRSRHVRGGRGASGRERTLALVVVLLATMAGVLVALAVERNQFEDRQRGRAAVAAQATRGAVERITSALNGASALIDADGGLDRRRFTVFADDLLRDRAVRGIFLVERLSDVGRPAWERRNGVDVTDPAGRGRYRRALRRNQYTPTLLVRPPSLRRARGFDPLGEPRRGTAVRRARDRGTVQLSRPVELVQARAVGLVAYVPLYRTRTVPRTLTGRRRAFLGAVGSSFPASAIGAAVASQVRTDAEVRVLDRGEVVVGSPTPLDDGEEAPITIAGRRWVVELAGGDAPSPFPAVVVGLAGLLVALLVDSRVRRLEQLRAASIEQERLAAEREEALRQQRFLADAGTVLDASLDLEAILQSLADLLVPDVAGWCAVALADPSGWETVAVAHSDPDKRALALQVDQRWPPEARTDRGVGKVLRTGEPDLLPVIPEELLEEVAQDAEHLATLRALGMTSAMIVPLAARGRVLGALTLISDDPGRRFGEADLDFAAQLARRAALAVDNAQLHDRTVRTARTLQAGLLPSALPHVPDVALAARYRPSGEDTEVGGDFYDVHALEAGGWAVTVGDVCGKGAEAAALTALIRYTLRAVAEDGPSDALRRLNEAVVHQRPDGTFATLVHLRVLPDGEDLRLQVVCAGHPRPVVRRAGGTLGLLGGRGPLVGAFAGLSWPVVEERLRPGDAVALYTDGVTEAAEPPLTPEALLAALEGVGAGAETLASALERLALDAPRAGRDDVAVLAVERLAPVAPVHHELPADAQAPGLARLLIESHLDRLAPDRRDDARLLVTETVTNAVRHGTPPVTPIELEVTDLPSGVRFVVRDRGSGMAEVPAPPAPGAQGGYGLQLVERLSDRWGWSNDRGTTVWFEVDAVRSRPTDTA